MSNFKFQNILIFFIFLILFLVIIYPKPIHGPWDEYHLLFFIQNHILFPFYDMNFPYYDTFSLGRFSPLAGQEFNLPILLNLSLDNLRFFLFFEFILLIYLSFKLYGKNSFFELNAYYFLLFLFLIIISPGFIITSTRFLYSEDFLSLLIVIFFIIYYSYKQNKKYLLLKNTILFFLLAIILLYKESSFIFFSTFLFVSIFLDYKKNKLNQFDLILLSLCFFYIFFYFLVRSNFLGENNYANPDNIFNIKIIFLTFIKFFLNDVILFLVLIPICFIQIIFNKNNFYIAIFVSSIAFISFYIILGMYSPYYLFPIYFLLIPIFFEFLDKINFKKKYKFLLFSIYLACVIIFSLFNSLFYFQESRARAYNFQYSLNAVHEKISNNNKSDITNIFICGNHDAGYLSQMYIFGEHLKFNKLSINDFDFKSFKENDISSFYTKNSPFDPKIDSKNPGYYSIFNNTNLHIRPTNQDLFLSLPDMSLNTENTCHKQYMDLFENFYVYNSTVRVTLLSNLLKRSLNFNSDNEEFLYKKNYDFIIGYFK